MAKYNKLNDKIEKVETIPLVSVIMAVYNDAQYLGGAIESILNQTFTDFEFIIIDDGSKDNSCDIVRRYKKRDCRIIFLKNEKNVGLALSLNRGIELAKGKYIARMDADDVAMPDRIEKQVKYLNSQVDCVAVGGNVVFMDSEGEIFGKSDNPLKHKDIETDLWNGLASSLVHPTVMYRKEAVLKVGCYSEETGLSEDLDLYLKLADIGKLANLSDKLLRFRRHCGSVTAVGKETEANIRRMKVLKDAQKRRGITDRRIELFDFSLPRTRGEWHADIAWRAYKNGYDKASRKHARLAIRYGVFNYLSWRAFIYLSNNIGRKILSIREKNKRKA